MKYTFPPLLSAFILFSFFNLKSQDFCISKTGIIVNEILGSDKIDKPVLFKLNTATPIAQSEMLPNGNDIRFYSTCDEISSLPYWIEKGLNTDSTHIWIRMPELLANSTDTIYWCYGNSAADSISSFENTFSNNLIINSDITVSKDDSLWDYDQVFIEEGTTVTLAEEHAGLTINAYSVIIKGNIDGNEAGYAGGDFAGNGEGPGGGRTTGFGGGGGGAYGGKGGTAVGGPGGIEYGSVDSLEIYRGSGGGGADNELDNYGGAGGGMIKIISHFLNIDTNAIINLNGADGDGLELAGTGGGGGGAGGGFLAAAKEVKIFGSISCTGGDGGMAIPAYEPGGGGGGGRIKLFYENDFDTTGIQLDVSNGLAGVGGQGGFEATPGDVGSFHLGKTKLFEESISISFISRNLCGSCVTELTNTTRLNTMCEGDSLDISFSADKGFTPYVYSWSNTSINSPTINVKPQESQWIYIDVTEDGGNGCTQRDSIFITVNQNPTSEISKNNTIEICEKNQLSLSPNNFGGSGNYTAHLWSGDTDYLSSTFLPNVSFNAQDTGSYFLKYQVWDSNSCTAEDSINISVLQGPRVNPRTSVTVCQFDDLKLYGNPSSGSGSYVAHLWQGDNDQLNGDTISEAPIFFATVPGVFSLNYTVTDFLGCTASANVTVNVNEAPVVNMPDTIEACRTSDLEVESIISNGSGVYTNYTWFNPEGKIETLNQSSNRFNTSEAGMFDLNLMVEDSRTCIGEKDVKILIHQLPEIDLEQYIETCVGTDVRLEPNISNTPIENATYLWEGETDLLNGSSFYKPIFRHNQPGEYAYTFNVSDDNGCENSANTIVVNYENPSADFNFNNELENFSFNANQGNLTTYNWDFGDGSSVTSTTRDTTHTYQEKGTYDVCLDVIDVNTCMAQLCKPVEVKNITSIDEIQNNTQLSAFPNPFTNYIEIKGLEKETEYQLISEDGKVIKSGNTKGRINLQSINNGKYILEIKTKKKQTFAVIKN